MAPPVAEPLRHLMDQHDLTRADMVPILGTPSRVSEVLSGKKGLSMAMMQRLRVRFRVPADLLLPPPKKASASRPTSRDEMCKWGIEWDLCEPGLYGSNLPKNSETT